MANEYKLSYTASEINEKLGKIDGLASGSVDIAYDNTETGLSATTLKSAVDELFTSVSNGKALVASAITDKGIATSNDATFETMASNIAAIESGGGSIETCTVTITAYELEDWMLSDSIIYTDVNSAYIVKTLEELNPVETDGFGGAYEINAQIEVQVGSLFCSTRSIEGSEGEITILNLFTAEINGNTTIII